ncbi:MAG TPA: response regulator transcription factor [Vicinamibacterales bacterium]|nr:response regulator transcription factor [Vicinamibacterales bacterium]
MIRVLLAEDHATVREGLRLLLDGQSDMEVVGEACDGMEAIELATQLTPDVIVLDLTMPNRSGLSAARDLRAASPTSAIVVLTRHDEAPFVQELVGAGALGYVLKQSSSSELMHAIRAAARGERYLDSTIPAPQRRSELPPQSRSTRLTDREVDVLRRTAAGHSNKDIANALDISIKTVEVHKAKAMRRLGLRDRADVVRFAVMRGWLQEL